AGERWGACAERGVPGGWVRAGAEPPPGAGECLRVSLQNWRKFIFKSDFLAADSILDSIIFSFGSKGFSSLSPIERIAMSISSSSATPSDHFCLRRKYLPASIKHFLGTMPTISDPVALRPRYLAAS